MSTTTYLITGASRGLGVETVRQLLAHDKSFKVIAAARNPDSAEELQQLKKEHGERLYLVKADVTDAQSIKSAAAELEKSEFGQSGIDVLINNAGVATGGMTSALETTIDDFKSNIETNVYGVVNATLGFLPLLRKGQKKQIFTTSSVLGSIGGPTSQASVAASYSASKAAVNMWMVKLARDLEKEEFTVIVFHPGYVKTPMNGGASGPAELDTPDAVSQYLKNCILNKTRKDNLSYLTYDGKTLPW